MKRFVLLIIFLSFFAPAGLRASDYTDYVEAKKDFLQADRDYLEYMKEKEKLAAESRAGLAAFKKKRAWEAWRAEYTRRIYVYKRDSKDRQPASVQWAEWYEYRRERKKEHKGIEADRLEHIRLRDIREKAREEVQTNPISDSVRARNEQPWNE